MMNRIPTMLTAIHAAISLLLFGTSHAMPPGGIGGGIGYITALAAFIINLPGVLTIRQFTAIPQDGLTEAEKMGWC